MKNLAFIDGQNMHLGTVTSKVPWKIDLGRFRTYLKYKYKVDKAYYFIGYFDDKNKKLYNKIQETGFILVFKQHSLRMIGKKKGNVDSDIIFSVMEKICLKENFEKIVLVSGDGDYKMLIDFLIKKDKFEKILFPNKHFTSSLYKNLNIKWYDYLDNKNTIKKVSL